MDKGTHKDGHGGTNRENTETKREGNIERTSAETNTESKSVSGIATDTDTDTATKTAT